VRRRFFVDQFNNQTAVIDGETAHHLGRVLRAQPGQLYELSDGSHVWLARIETVTRDRIDFALLEELPSYPPAVDLTLLLSVVKFDAFEWAIEKATELGVSRIVPLAAARSEKGLLAAAAKRSERWTKILVESSQQSRRVRLPVLDKLASPADAFSGGTEAVRLMLSERADAPSLRHIFEDATIATKSKKVVLAIGPEGGWTEPELELARRGGFREASLGRLILRAETAVIAALASINYALGD
jgi:16S rRNA (uracil1498-N3)-methyltransferase